MTTSLMTKRQHRRHGTLYISVLGTALMISIAGMTAIHLARTELRAAVGDCETTRARLAAEAAVSYGLATIELHTDWRTRFDARQPIEVDGGEFQFMFDAGVQPDGSPAPLDQEDVSLITLRGIGRSGGSLSVAEVTLQNDGAGLSILNTALSAAGNINLMQPPVGQLQLQVDNIVYAGRDIVCVEGRPTIVGDTEAVGTITDNIASGAETEGVAQRTFPDASAVFDYYKRRGTWIRLGGDAELQLRRVLISPSHNPFGSETNPEGIYVIDCEGRSIQIEESRILGTLVLLNNADDSTIQGSMNWTPFVENYPALMTENGCVLNYDSKSRLEERSASVNFNPPGAPYDGHEDSDQRDRLDSEINGLVYIGGVLSNNATGCSRINGVVVCNSAVLGGDLEINFSSVSFDTPPPGFVEPGSVQVQVGSWRRGEN